MFFCFRQGVFLWGRDKFQVSPKRRRPIVGPATAQPLFYLDQVGLCLRGRNKFQAPPNCRRSQRGKDNGLAVFLNCLKATTNNGGTLGYVTWGQFFEAIFTVFILAVHVFKDFGFRVPSWDTIPTASLSHQPRSNGLHTRSERHRAGVSAL